MKLKLVEIMNINQIVQVIINDAVCNDPLFKFKLLGISKTLQTYVDDFGVIRNDKIKEYGTFNDEKGIYEIAEDDTDTIEKINSDLEKVINETFDIEIQPLKPTDIFDKGVDARYLVGLYPLIEEA